MKLPEIQMIEARLSEELLKKIELIRLMIDLKKETRNPDGSFKSVEEYYGDPDDVPFQELYIYFDNK